LSGALDELATRYAQIAATHGLPTPATYGRKCGGSSPTANLQQSLESRLKARMGDAGSPEYAVRWKSVDMLLGPRICALRASARRISDSGISGWPSPTKGNADGSQMAKGAGATGRRVDGSKATVSLNQVATLAGWPTPMAGNPGTEDYNPAGNTDSSRKTEALLAGWSTPRREDSESTGAHRGTPDTLTSQARLTGWATPTSNPANGEPENFLNRKRRAVAKGSTMGVALTDLQMQAKVAFSGWATPNATDGSKAPKKFAGGNPSLPAQARGAASPSSVTTANGGASPATKKASLNPLFSLWLMLGRFAIEWARCAAAVTRSSRRSPQNSSRPGTRREGDAA
jgi:hypothetical protein